MERGKTYRILSIDGGGILGLYSAKIIEYIKNEFLKDQELYDYFNLITGTSTGGIIALGLAAGKDISEIVQFYTTYGERIFPYKNPIIHKIMSLRAIWGTKYLHKTIDRIATDFFGDLKIKDAKCSLCVPAIDVVNCQPIVFKTPHSEKLSRDDDFLMKDIALATSSAPTFFPIYSFNIFSGLVDGGLWQNNPALIGLIEAENYFVGEGKEFDNIEIISVGNPHSNLKKTISVKNKRSSLMKWRTDLIELPMKITSKGTDQIISFLERNNSLDVTNYLRISSDNISVDQQNLYLDLANKKSIHKLLELAHHDFFNKKEAIRKFIGDRNA